MTLGFQLGSTEVLGVYMGGLRKREKERKAWGGVGNQESSSGRPKTRVVLPASKEQIIPSSTSCPQGTGGDEMPPNPARHKTSTSQPENGSTGMENIGRPDLRA